MFFNRNYVLNWRKPQGIIQTEQPQTRQIEICKSELRKVKSLKILLKLLTVCH